MQIVILQQEISFGDKYQIFTDEQQTHAASIAMFHLQPVIHLTEYPGLRSRMTITRKIPRFKAAFELERWDHIVLPLTGQSLWGN